MIKKVQVLSQEMFDTTQITKNWGIFQGQLWP